jgi:hypothetical protein
MTPENIKDLKIIIHETIEENPSIITMTSDIKELKTETKRLGEKMFEMSVRMDEMSQHMRLILAALVSPQARALTQTQHNPTL